MLRKIQDTFARLKVEARPSDDDDGMDFCDGPIQREHPIDRYIEGRRLEALALEPIIAPTLGAMRDKTILKEAMVSVHRREGTSLAQEVQEALTRRPSAQLADALDENGVALLKAPMPSTPTIEKDNPFDVSTALEAIITPMPKRLGAKPRPVSYRSRREMPLRVQTLRRNHQAAFVDAVMRQIEEEAATFELQQPPQGRQTPDEDAPWRNSPDFSHWDAYTIGPAPTTPLPADEGPAGELPVIYFDQHGRPFI